MSEEHPKVEIASLPLDVKVVEEAISPTKEKQAVQAQTAKELEETLHSAGQRATSMEWETTQKKLALEATRTSLLVSGSLAIFGKFIGSPEIQLAAIVFLFSTVSGIIGFYFGKSNHSRVGGIGGDTAGTR